MRRLAAILVADVVGYSHLMEEDEAGTLAALRAHRSELIDPTVVANSGRIVKSTGDGVLVEFGSVVDATACAVQIQQRMAKRNANLANSQRLVFRMGINIGDIIIEDEDIQGDGVNVAARLEQLAEPGGICMSRSARNQIRGKVPYSFEDLGEKKVKNITRPLRVFRVVIDGQEGKPAKIVKTRPVALGRLVLSLTVLILFVASGVVAWLKPWAPQAELASVENAALPVPAKPSIAVLPFNNMSKDADQEYFADGITDDLITDLSKVSGLFVIARNSTFVYKGEPVKIRKVAEDLGVRYVLEGSVRRVDDQIRVNAQLIDATTGGHVWADRFDGNATKVFEVQDDFIRQIVGALKLKLTSTEETEITAGRTDQIEARGAFQKGWERYIQFSRGENAKAVSHFERAISLDPEYGRAYAALALVYLRDRQCYGHERLYIACVKSKRIHANKYIALAEQYPTSLAHIAKSLRSLSEGQHQNAFLEANSALKADPNDPEAYLALGWSMILTGRASDGQVYVEQAMRLNPTYPGHYSLALGIAYFAQGDPKNAAAVMEDGLKRNPGALELTAPLASMYGRLGERKKARRALLLWRPTADESAVVNLPTTYRFPYKWHMDQFHIGRSLYDGLQVAAMPLQTTLASWIDSAGSGNFFHRLRAIKSIGYFGPLAAEAVPILIKALSEENQAMRIEAVVALEKIGPGAKDAVAALEDLKKTDVSISNRVDAALNAIVK